MPKIVLSWPCLYHSFTGQLPGKHQTHNSLNIMTPYATPTVVSRQSVCLLCESLYHDFFLALRDIFTFLYHSDSFSFNIHFEFKRRINFFMGSNLVWPKLLQVNPLFLKKWIGLNFLTNIRLDADQKSIKHVIRIKNF